MSESRNHEIKIRGEGPGDQSNHDGSRLLACLPAEAWRTRASTGSFLIASRTPAPTMPPVQSPRAAELAKKL